jgi:hypothetical protein
VKQSGPSSKRKKRRGRRLSWKPVGFKSKKPQLGEKKCGEKPASGNRKSEMW